MKSINLLLIICVAVVACNYQPEKPPNKEAVYGHVLPVLYDTLYMGLGQPKGQDILINPADDHLDSVFITRALQDMDDKESSDYKLIEELNFKLNIKPTFDFQSLSTGANLNFISNKTTLETYNYDKGTLIGSSTISDIAFTQDQHYGLFYVDLQCGRSCGAGLLVFVKLIEDKWIVDKVIQIWES